MCLSVSHNNPFTLLQWHFGLVGGSGFYYTINTGCSPGLLSDIPLLSCVVKILQRWICKMAPLLQLIYGVEAISKPWIWACVVAVLSSLSALCHLRHQGQLSHQAHPHHPVLPLFTVYIPFLSFSLPSLHHMLAYRNGDPLPTHPLCVVSGCLWMTSTFRLLHGGEHSSLKKFWFQRK